jgi:hypothetical protein
LRAMCFELQGTFKAEVIAYSKLPRPPNSFNMQEDVLVDMEDRQMGDSEPSLEGMVVDNVSISVTQVEHNNNDLATWEKYSPIERDTAPGTAPIQTFWFHLFM